MPPRRTVGDIADEYLPGMDVHEMNLLLLNEPLAGIVMLTEDILDELQGLPEPSVYAHHKTWRVWQGKSLIFDRPPIEVSLFMTLIGQGS